MSTKLLTFAAGAAILATAGLASAKALGPKTTFATLRENVYQIDTVPLPLGETPQSVQGPLQLYYQTTDLNNGTWLYNFTLKNTNIDNSWQNGQNFDWIIFGDQANAASNLLNWAGDVSSLAGSPWAADGFSSSGGGHNGPTLLDWDGGFTGWIPGFVGDSVSWSGTATVDLPEPELLWSNLAGTGAHADFLPAIKVPAPGCVALLGLAGLAAGRRRR